MFSSSIGMPLRWRKQAQRPPGPFVEDEVDSLCRELDGKSRVGELSGFEGAKSRGTVEQSPLILDVDTVHAPVNAPKNFSSNVEEKQSSGYRPSGFNANTSYTSKMDTRQGPKQDPIRRPAGENLSQDSEKPRSRSPPRSQGVFSMSQQSRSAHTQIPDIPGSFPTSQRPSPSPREPEPTPRAPTTYDALPPKLPPKPKEYMFEKDEPASIRTTSIRREQEQHSNPSPTRYTQQEPVRARAESPAKSTPDVTERRPTSHSRTSSSAREEQYTTHSSSRYEPTSQARTPSLPRGQEQQTSGSASRYEQSESMRVRMNTPAKSTPDVIERRPTSHSRTPSMSRGQEQHGARSSTRYEESEAVRVRMSSPAKSTPDVASKSHCHSRAPSLPREQEELKFGPPTRPSQPEPVRNPSVRTTSSAKPMPEITERRQTAPSSSLREREQQSSTAPTTYIHPERAQPAVRPKPPPKSPPEVVQTSQNVPSRTPSVRRDTSEPSTSTATGRPRSESARDSSLRTGSLPPPQPASRSFAASQDTQNRSSPTGPAQPASTRESHVRSGSVPPKPAPGVVQPQHYPARAPAPLEGQNRPMATVSSQPPSGRDSHVRTGSLPPTPAFVPQSLTYQLRPAPVPQQVQNRPLPTVLPQPAPIRDTSARGPAPPPKPMHEVTRQSQPTIPRPLPTPPDDEPPKPRHTSVPYQPETIVRDSGVRVEMLPLRSMPEVPQTNERPISVASDETQYKSFNSTIPPPRSLSETPPTLQTIPLSNMPLRSIPLNPLPNPPTEVPRHSSTVKESPNLKQAPPATSTASIRSSKSEYGTAAARPNQVTRPSSHSTKVPDAPPSPGLSVAERLEEKLKVRREQRDVPQQNVSAQTHSSKSKTPSPPVSQSSDRGRSIQPPGAWPADSPSESSSRLTQFPTLEQSPVVKKETTPPPKPVLKSALRSRSLDRSTPAATKAARRRTVAFAENPLEYPYPSQALIKVDHETSLTRAGSDSDSDSNRSSSPNTGLTLSPCPRSIPVAGYQDWYTIEGLTHLDICPSCVKQMRKSKFRDRLILAAPKSRTEPIRCAMSEPWPRLAWMQTLKKKFETLDVLHEVTRPSHAQGPKFCTGRIINDQHWYRIVDPDTGSYLPQFNICSACVRNIRLLMPIHRETFQRSTAPQERVCDFVADSPRFIRYIDALDLASNRAEQEEAKPDLSEFLAYARRKVVLRDCRRSRLVFDKWHYMPQLPEFTVCEDCYDDIVWPLSKARHPIARDFSSVMRLLPADTGSSNPSSSREASCQLYSPRIRAKFNDAVRRDDLPFIKWMAITRFEAEKRFRDRQDELLEDQRRGYDRSQDLRKNLEDWKRYE